MTTLTAVILFVIIWWTVLFAVLPWGNRAVDPDQVEPGHAPSAPAKPRLGLKFLITTGISILLWLAIYGLIQAEIFSFRDWAAGWD